FALFRFLLGSSGSDTPATRARVSTAVTNVQPVISISNLKISPVLPLEKSCHICLRSTTVKLGDFSLLNGERHFHSEPAFFRPGFRRLTTSETSSRERRSSRNW